MKTFTRILSLSLLALTLFGQGLFAQSYPIGERSVTFTDASRNRQIPVEIYYPATSSGVNAPLATGEFPVVVFGHGFVMTWSVYSNIWEGLVPEGFIMAFARTETGFFPSHGDFGQDLAFIADQMQAEGADNNSFFFGAIKDSTAVMGHSMGGGATFLAPQHSANITALAPLAPAETNPSAIAAVTSIGLPTLILAGSNDCVTPPAQHQIPMYDSLASGCKSYVELTGGGHCYFAEFDFNCNFGEQSCSPSPTLTRTQQQSLTLQYLLPWLKYQLQGDCAAGDDFQNLVSQNTTDLISQNCSIGCGATSISPANFPDLNIGPNPFTHSFRISGLKRGKIDLFDLNGRRIDFRLIERGSELEIIPRPGEPNGLLVLRIQQNNTLISKKLIHSRN